jgi:hypothetical protein
MLPDPKLPSTDRLPKAIYAVLAGLVGWLALAAWGFAGSGYADFSLAVVTGFLLIVIAIPFVLSRVGRANGQADAAPERRDNFADWTAGQFETWQDRVKGSNAATEIILPIAAAAVGMTAFAIVFHYVAAHASR